MIDWTKIFNKYKGQWVALKDDEKTVVGNGPTLKTALAKAENRGFDHPIMMKVPRTLSAYVGGF